MKLILSSFEIIFGAYKGLFKKEEDIKIEFWSLTLILIFLGLVLSFELDTRLVSVADISLVLHHFLSNVSEPTLWTDWSRYAWSSFHQIGALLVYLGFEHNQISLFFGTLGTISATVGVGLLLRSINLSIPLILVLVPILIFFKSIPSLSADYYYSGIYSPHLSHFAINIFLLSLGLMATKKILFSCFLSTFLISIHVLFGSFFFLVMILTILCQFLFFNYRTLDFYDKRTVKKYFTGFSIGLFFCLISLLIHMTYSFSDSGIIDTDSFTAYMAFWESHRSNQINWSTFTLGFLFGCIFLLLEIRKAYIFKKSSNSLIIFLNLLLITSCLVYVIPTNLFYNATGFDLNKIVLGRFMALNGLIVTINFIFHLSKYINQEYLFIKRYLLTHFFLLFALLILIYNSDFQPFYHPEDGMSIPSIRDNFLILFLILFVAPFISLFFKFVLPWLNKRFFKRELNKAIILLTSISCLIILFPVIKNELERSEVSKEICKEVNSDKAVLVATRKELNNVFRLCKKIIFIDILSFDVIPYIPSKSFDLNQLISIGYGVNFLNPPTELHRTASLGGEGEFFKKTWESRSKADWVKISKEIGIEEIAVPTSWEVNLERSAVIYDSAIYSVR